MRTGAATRAEQETRLRSRFHPGRVWSDVAVWWGGKNFTQDFWKFLAGDFLYDSGGYVFFLLYNLYLLDLGYRENFLGWVAGLMAVGNIVGSLPAGWAARRLGMRGVTLLCFALVPLSLALRATLSSAPWLLALAFLGGVVSSLWPVAQPLIVADLTDTRNRPFAFSFVSAVEIGFGILAGAAGGYLPGWLSHGNRAVGAAPATRAAILVTCGLSLFALWPASRLKLTPAPAGAERRIYPRDAFVWRFLVATGLWSFATGAFNPFYNAYFAHFQGASVARIGMILAASQFVQVVAILAAPALFRRVGLVTGIVLTQIACAASLVWLSTGPQGWGAAAAYCAYSGFQWMSDPAFYSLLMTKVVPSERAGASSLYFLVVSVVQGVAAVVAGEAFARFGYPSVMTVIAGGILAAALLFRFLLSGSESAQPSSLAAAE